MPGVAIHWLNGPRQGDVGANQTMRGGHRPVPPGTSSRIVDRRRGEHPGRRRPCPNVTPGVGVCRGTGTLSDERGGHSRAQSRRGR
jgi:hypothetical protein